VTLLYNIAILVVDLAAISIVRRRLGLPAWLATMGSAAVVTFLVAAFLGGCFENHFGFLRLWSYGVFLHGPLLLLATAVLWRRIHPRLAVVAVLGILVLMAIAVEAFLIEPHWLETTRYQIASPKIHRPLRIVVVADLQTDAIGPYEESVLRQTLEAKPDLILLAGDYWQTIVCQEYQPLQKKYHDLLQELRFSAPLGVFAVQGNVDEFCWNAAFENLDITTILQTKSFDLGDLRLTCLSRNDSFFPTTVVENPDPAQFHLVLGHSPNFALSKIEADLMVTGHTHGGQVRLPGIGPMITHSRIPHSWAAGVTELSGRRLLFVSRGIGMERDYAPRMRFLCRPELAIIDLVPSARKEEKEAGEGSDGSR